MITLKQVEALHWIVELGTFERAAAKLNTTQSAISKRIGEFEEEFGLPIFVRNQRGAKLTEEGEHLLELGREMLSLQDRMLEVKKGKQTPSRRLQLGVTELTSLTWLPRLVTALRETFPSVIIEPDVDTSRNLHERLLEGDVDLIIIPEVVSDPQVTVVRLAEVPNAWLARPGLVKARQAIPLADLAQYPILTQGGGSWSGLFMNKWLKSSGFTFPRMISTNNLTALLGLTVAGLGVSYSPVDCFRPLIDKGRLTIIPTLPELPPFPYAAMYRNDRPSSFISTIVNLACDVCDFSQTVLD